MKPVQQLKRIWHPWWLWEDYPAGFYETLPNKEQTDAGIETYRKFLSDLPRFDLGLERVLDEWSYSCEQNLSNENMNRIAWLGQASVCIEEGIPSHCRVGFSKLTEDQRYRANRLALVYLNKWLAGRGELAVTLDQGLGVVSCKS